MNKKAQETLQPSPAEIAKPSNKKLLVIAAVAVVIIILAVAAYFIFANKNASQPVINPDEIPPQAPATDSQKAEQVLNDLSSSTTPEEKEKASSVLDDLSKSTTPEDKQRADEIMRNL